jgi:hypothetical protein
MESNRRLTLNWVPICCTWSVQQSNINKFLYHLVGQCLCIYYTQLLYVPAIYPDCLQGVTSFLDMYTFYHIRCTCRANSLVMARIFYICRWVGSK